MLTFEQFLRWLAEAGTLGNRPNIFWLPKTFLSDCLARLHRFRACKRLTCSLSGRNLNLSPSLPKMSETKPLFIHPVYNLINSFLILLHRVTATPACNKIVSSPTSFCLFILNDKVFVLNDIFLTNYSISIFICQFQWIIHLPFFYMFS